jgi:hypothetical protein
MSILLYDDVYAWHGWGGTFKLGSGKCHMRIFDRSKGGQAAVAHVKPFLVLLTDIPESSMSVRSCTGHIATCVTKEFNLDPRRMLWIEYYPQVTYGTEGQNVIPERYDSVEFSWYEDKAIDPKWTPLNGPVVDEIKGLLATCADEAGHQS